jgi:hypothetical protein
MFTETSKDVGRRGWQGQSRGAFDVRALLPASAKMSLGFLAVSATRQQASLIKIAARGQFAMKAPSYSKWIMCKIARRGRSVPGRLWQELPQESCGRVQSGNWLNGSNADRPGDMTLTPRTTRTTVSFSSPFTLRSLEGVQPAGEYVILSDDELIEGLSRAAYRRVATLFQTPAISGPQRQIQLISISQTELDAALMKDRQQTIVVH